MTLLTRRLPTGSFRSSSHFAISISCLHEVHIHILEPVLSQLYVITPCAYESIVTVSAKATSQHYFGAHVHAGV